MQVYLQTKLHLDIYLISVGVKQMLQICYFLTFVNKKFEIFVFVFIILIKYLSTLAFIVRLEVRYHMLTIIFNLQFLHLVHIF